MYRHISIGNFTSTLVALFEKDVRFATVIDIGCADGHFYLQHRALGVLPGATVVHIDPNPIYEPSLKAIQEALGGHYLIGAASDRNGEMEMTLAAHPYWGSLRPPGDLYWERLNGMHSGTTTVPTVTLDTLTERLGLKGPFLIKLDVQGAEREVLAGARKVLADTHAVICEADVADFHAIAAEMATAEFDLFDVTSPNWLPDRTLGWFYPVFLNRRLDHLRTREFWAEHQNEEALRKQTERRQNILQLNAAWLEQLRGQN